MRCSRSVDSHAFASATLAPVARVGDRLIRDAPALSSDVFVGVAGTMVVAPVQTAIVQTAIVLP